MTELPEEALRDPSDFKPKLNFEQRCSVLALFRRGVKPELLAKAFGINRRTVGYIVNNGTHYRSVRLKESELGTQDFITKYTTDDALVRVREATAEVSPVFGSKTDSNAAKKAARAKEGINAITDLKGVKHRVEIAYLDANTAEDDNGVFEHPAGWYSKDMDGSTPNRWSGDIDTGTHLTSMSAYKHAVAIIMESVSE